MEHEFIMLFRCTTKEYAEKFIQTGNIRFGKPQEWIECYKKYGKGRGDLFEGTFASIQKSVQMPKTLLLLRDNCELLERKDRIYFSSSKVKQYRTFGLYGLDLERFENKKGYPHGIYPTFTLKQEYFKDFYQEEESSCVELKEKDKPVLLIIKNVSLFFDRLITKLISLGFKKEEIIIMPVKYVNIHTNFISPREPYELFLKDVSYFNQSEIRIVLNLDNVDAMNRIEKTNGIIDLDCYMGDISYISDYYFKDMVMQLKGNQFLYSLPKEKEYSFSELGREFFIGTILQILENELPQRHFKDYEEMKEFIKPLSRELEKRFDMSFDLEKKMFYKISTKEYYNITLKKD